MSIVRPHNFFGPREGYEHVIPEFILRSIDRKDPFPLHGEQEKRSYCYIDDAVDAMVRIMESEKTDGHIYHVGSQEEKKGINLALTICKLMGWEPKKFDGKPGLKGSVNRRLSSLHKIKNDIGWEPKTTIEEGLKKTIEWYVANPRLDE
jgi:nucleoside-diphosphate-sugar epimerase